MEGRAFHYEYNGEEALFLAGDIHTLERHHQLIEQVPQDVRIFMVAGNHEYYHGDFEEVKEALRVFERIYPNFHFLDNGAVCFKDVEIFGGTMFTDFDLHGPNEMYFAKEAARYMIADFTHIRDWTLNKHCDEFIVFERNFVPWLKQTEGRKRIVITHFMPTEYGGNPVFKNNRLNPYFTCNMERYMGWEGFWLCGHGHDTRDVLLGDTRVVMNPRGYRGEDHNGFNPNLILEI